MRNYPMSMTAGALLALVAMVIGGCDEVATTTSQDPQATGLACLPDCSGADLNDADLAGTNLREANLREASLAGANLSNTDLDGADLRGADLRGARMISTVLRGADLSGADLTGANLNNANLAGAILRGADLTRVNLRDANLAGVDLTAATLTDADLRRADMRGVNLTAVSGCDVSGRVPGCPTIGNIIWWFVDACDDALQNYIRFFDVTNDLVWPGPDSAYTLDQLDSYNLACRTDAKVCFGAEDEWGVDIWGVGIDGSESCEACCQTCPAGGETVELSTIGLFCGGTHGPVSLP